MLDKQINKKSNIDTNKCSIYDMNIKYNMKGEYE